MLFSSTPPLPGEVKIRRPLPLGKFFLGMLLILMSVLHSLSPNQANAAPPSSGTGAEQGTLILQVQDKISGHVSTMELPVGDTRQFGPLIIHAERGLINPPEERPETYAFLTIIDTSPYTSGEPSHTPTTTTSRVAFSNWMFASSPALSALDHPLYDTWVIGCKGCPVRDSSEDDAPAIPISPGVNFKALE